MSIIYPLVHKGAPEFQISDADFAELQRLGEIILSAELRSRLNDLAQFWAAELVKVQSPRPKQFRTRLKLIGSTLAEAYEALDLNRAGTSIWERHLFNWARNAEVEGATTFFDDTDELLLRMRRMIDLMARLQQALPGDGGGPRPYNDKRLFIALADIFNPQEGPQSLTGVNTKTQAEWPIQHFAGSCTPSTKCFLFNQSASRPALMRSFGTR